MSFHGKNVYKSELTHRGAFYSGGNDQKTGKKPGFSGPDCSEPGSSAAPTDTGSPRLQDSINQLSERIDIVDEVLGEIDALLLRLGDHVAQPSGE